MLDPITVNVIKALGEAGIGIVVVAIVGQIVIILLRFLSNFLVSNNKSNDKKWDDFMMIRKEDRETDTQMLSAIKDILEELKDSRRSQDSKMNEGMAEIKKRFDAIEEGVRYLHDGIDEIRSVLLNTRAGG